MAHNCIDCTPVDTRVAGTALSTGQSTAQSITQTVEDKRTDNWPIK